MNLPFPAKWFCANAVGLSLGFTAVLQTGFLLQFGLNFEEHWSPAALGQGVWLGYRFIGLLLGGLIFSAFQALALAPRLPRVSAWVGSGAIGYGLVAVIIWPFWVADVWGRIPGPVEPMLITIGGGSLMGLIQWWHLRSSAVNATKWLLWWLAGLLVSLPVTFAVFVTLIVVLKLQLPWAAEVALNGLVAGGVAGLISARATQSLSFQSAPLLQPRADA